MNEYGYVGTHVVAKLAIVVSLIAAAPATGHVAGWLGQSNGHRKWVQAGIEESSGGQPQLYVEWKHDPHSEPQLLLEPTVLGRSARVRIERRGKMYRALVGDLKTPWTYIRHSERLDTLELWRNAHGSAMIDGRFTRG